MKNQLPNFQTEKKYDLEERTAKFAEEIIDLAKKLPRAEFNKRMIEQVVASAGSIGANYCEANEAESRTDFVHKIGICKKETKETKHWIRLLAYANPVFKEDFHRLWKEAEELLLIFSAIIRKTKNRKV
jgi:four helix bundle protein